MPRRPRDVKCPSCGMRRGAPCQRLFFNGRLLSEMYCSSRFDKVKNALMPTKAYALSSGALKP